MHRPREEVAVLAKHVGHHECGGQLGVGVGVEQAVVGQRVEGVAGLVLHEVQQGGVGVVWGRDGGDLIVLVARPASSSAVTASALTGVVLKTGREKDREFFLNETGGRCLVSLKKLDGQQLHWTWKVKSHYTASRKVELVSVLKSPLREVLDTLLEENVTITPGFSSPHCKASNQHREDVYKWLRGSSLTFKSGSWFVFFH